ncbi:unnamed protein product [Arctia plantaginis]|uniref:Uncharacterized protein n=1 Tax=Arctia plantaginis TaxID=874455 RepID=A0A8S1B0R2_ARCPL|nr:unnamed protein product [Arctia plantaginis]
MSAMNECPHEPAVMRIAALIALVQLSLATAVSDNSIQTLSAVELNRELAGDYGLSPFYESSEETGVTFMRGSRAAESPLSPDIDVQCSGDFIDVTVEFSDIYDGIIYSKGFLNDPKCKDPKCPQPFAPSSTNPPSTYLPPFPAENEVKSQRALRLVSKEFDDDIGTTGQTESKSRKVREVTGISDTAAIASTGVAAMYIVMGSAVFMILSVSLAVYLYTNRRPRTTITTNATNSC